MMPIIIYLFFSKKMWAKVQVTMRRWTFEWTQKLPCWKWMKKKLCFNCINVHANHSKSATNIVNNNENVVTWIMNRVQKSCSSLNTSLEIPLIVLQYSVSGSAEILKKQVRTNWSKIWVQKIQNRHALVMRMQ